jgi:hypothetical protein
MKNAEHYGRRAAQRLNALLNEMGAPIDLLGRSKKLQALTNLDLDQTRRMLGGTVPWDWDQLATACAAFGKEPGYFLDEHPVPGIPSDTKVVTGADGGEAIAFRPPKGFLRSEVPGGPWRYASQVQQSAFFVQGSLVLFAEAATSELSLAPAQDYVVESEAGLDFMRCLDVRNTTAHLETGAAGTVPCVLPVAVSARPLSSWPRVVGRVLASVRAH